MTENAPKIAPGNWVRCNECDWGWMVDEQYVTVDTVLAQLKEHHGIEPEDAEAHVRLA